MGAQKSKVLIPLKKEDLQKLINETHFKEKEIKSMYKRYWAYCSPHATLNKQQFNNMFNGGGEKAQSIVDHIFRTTDTDDNMSLGKRFFELDFYIINFFA